MIIALITFCSIYILILMYKNAEAKERIIDLESRLEKLEEDVAKVTPHKVGDTLFMNSEITPDKVKSKMLVEGDVKSQSKGDTGSTQAAPPPKPPRSSHVLGEWQIKNGNPLRKKRKQVDDLDNNE